MIPVGPAGGYQSSVIPLLVKQRNRHANNTDVAVVRQEAGSAIRGRVRDIFVEHYEKKGLTQADFAASLGVKQGTVQPWVSESSEGSVPDAASLWLIAKRFGLSAHWLLTGAQPREAPGEDPNLRAIYLEGWADAERGFRAALDDLRAKGPIAAERATRHVKMARAGPGSPLQPRADRPGEASG